MKKNYFTQHKKNISLITNADEPAGQKSEPKIKLRGEPTQPALCGPKRGTGQNGLG